MYVRNGKPTGVILNRKFRFSTLGFTPEKLQKLELNPTIAQREKELLEILNKHKEKDKGIER